MKKYDTNGIETALKEGRASGWQHKEDTLYKSFKFKGFAQAWAFMNAGAQHAERLNHHPDWRNVYNRVEIALTTHDAGGITDLDFQLAEAINAIEEKSNDG